MYPIEYRPMEPADIEHVLVFWKQLDGIHLHDNGEETYDEICKYLKRNPGLSFVAVCDSKIVGAVMCGHDGRRAYLNHLGVSTEHRNKGIAKHLIQLVEEQLKEIGIKKEALFVLQSNQPAHKFYEHIGWKKENIVDIYAKVISFEGDKI